MEKVTVESKLIRDGSLSIRINKALKKAITVVTRKRKNSFADYIEELVIKDLEENHVEVVKQ